VRARKKRALRNGILYIAFILLLTAGAYGYKWLDHFMQERLSDFKLVDIEIKGNHILSRSDILSQCGLQPGEGQLLAVKAALVEEKLRQSHYIKAVSVVRSLPSKLRITVLEREPIAFIYGRGLNLIDEEGYLMPVPAKRIRWNLPHIIGIKESLGNLGEKTTSAQALKGVEIVTHMRMTPSALNEMVSDIDFSNRDYLRLRLIRGGAEVRIDEQDYALHLFILRQYLEKYLQWDDLNNIKYVDVRFNNQLIYKEKQG
jgi:cell division septal protein FtsQ